MMSERELIGGDWYYYLKATGKWHVYVWSKIGKMLIKLASDLVSLSEAQEFARNFDKQYKELIANGLESNIL